MGMFAVNEELAWEWVMRAIEAREMGDLYDPVATDLPPIGMGWQPQDVGEEDTTFLLIRGAREAGVLITPAHMELNFEFIDDGDNGCFRYLLCIDEPTPLVVASDAQEMCRLGEPETVSVDAALAILREAAHTANLLLQQLSTFVTASTSPQR